MISPKISPILLLDRVRPSGPLLEAVQVREELAIDEVRQIIAALRLVMVELAVLARIAAGSPRALDGHPHRQTLAWVPNLGRRLLTALGSLAVNFVSSAETCVRAGSAWHAPRYPFGMNNARRLVAALGLALFTVLVGSSCLLNQEPLQPTDNPAGATADEIGGFSPSLFPFITIIADDGEGVAGGWQAATATLKFRDLSYTPNPKSWQCAIRVEMPIRSTTNGIITPDSAAQISAARATFASSIVIHSQPEWPIAESFCRAFVNEMERGLKLFDRAAKVNKV